MKIQEIRSIAKARGLKSAKLPKAELIRAIQRDEGNTPCFGSDVEGRCDQSGCAWREDCIPAEKKQTV